MNALIKSLGARTRCFSTVLITPAVPIPWYSARRAYMTLPFATVTGTAGIRAEWRTFVRTFAQRIETGLVQGSSPRRNRYAVTREEGDAFGFRAMDWLTAFNVGLNDVELNLLPGGVVRYTIRYARWGGYAILGSAGLGIVLAATFIAIDIRDYISRQAASQLPGLSLDQNVAIAWAMVGFWGFVWPWILITLHKRPLRRLTERIIGEVDAVAIQRARASR